MHLHSCITSITSSFSFHMREKSHNFFKFSQEIVYPRAKWTHCGGSVAKAKGESNSKLKLLLTQTFLAVPCSSSYPSFTVPLSHNDKTLIDKMWSLESQLLHWTHRYIISELAVRIKNVTRLYEYKGLLFITVCILHSQTGTAVCGIDIYVKFIQ